MTAENVLGLDDRPRLFAAGNTAELGLSAAEPRYDVALRTYVRSLAGMQKEALVVSSATDLAWRLVSDEGPYLAGHDEAPFPLAFMAAGMVRRTTPRPPRWSPSAGLTSAACTSGWTTTTRWRVRRCAGR